MKNCLKPLFLIPLLLTSCNNTNSISSVAPDGYLLNAEYGFYEKIEEDVYNINIAKMSYPLVEKFFTLSKKYNALNIIGNAKKTIIDFSIAFENRDTAININLTNVSVKSMPEYAFLDLNNLSKTTNLTIDGECYLRGFSGIGGGNGVSFDINKGRSDPLNGGDGSEGQAGSSAIVGTDLIINVNQSSSLVIEGGNGGYGGNGGHGSGGDASNVGNSGNGGNGGTGGSGASAIRISSSLSIINNGTVTISGGNGGNGGSAGHGGNNAPANPLNVPDNGGNGGIGGSGGHGGCAISLENNATFSLTKNSISLIGGNGGDAGDGGNGGSSNYYFNVTPNPGDGGDGGNGGNGSNTTSIQLSDYSLIQTTPGIGGNYGHGGANSSYYYIGTTSEDGRDIVSKAGTDGYKGRSGTF